MGNETKFTKGDWSYEESGGDAKVFTKHGFLFSNNIIPVNYERLGCESWLEMRERTEPLRVEASIESNANVRLIASAPKLYAMLESHLLTLEELYPDHLISEEHMSEFKVVHMLMGNTKKLLAEARGES